MQRKDQTRIVALLLVGASACVMPQKQPPRIVAPSFTFDCAGPQAAKNGMTLAIIAPSTRGIALTGGVLGYAQDKARIQGYLGEMEKAATQDLEKIIVAKGFTTLPAVSGFDDLVYSDKERATLAVISTFDAKMDFQGGEIRKRGSTAFQDGTLLMTGRMLLELREPMTKEKVWNQAFSLDQFTEAYRATVKVTRADGQSDDPIGDLLFLGTSPQEGHKDQVEAAVDALNSFYRAAMTKACNHLDSREIQNLKAEAGRLKKRRVYN